MFSKADPGERIMTVCNTTRVHDWIYYDGTCGLCHGWVKFVLARDPEGKFHFAPLQGSRYRTYAPLNGDQADFDSVVVITAAGETLVRSKAVAYIFRRLGGLWWAAGVTLAALPTFLSDSGYRFVASIRHRLFARPSQACPLLPPELRNRFDT